MRIVLRQRAETIPFICSAWRECTTSLKVKRVSGFGNYLCLPKVVWTFILDDGVCANGTRTRNKPFAYVRMRFGPFWIVDSIRAVQFQPRVFLLLNNSVTIWTVACFVIFYVNCGIHVGKIKPYVVSDRIRMRRHRSENAVVQESMHIFRFCIFNLYDSARVRIAFWNFQFSQRIASYFNCQYVNTYSSTEVIKGKTFRDLVFSTRDIRL